MNGKKPQLRFAGFDDDWEQRRFIDCIENIIDFRGRTPKKLGMDWSESGYLALSALNVKDGYIDFTQDVHYGNQELYDKWMTGNELHQGQVLFTTEAPMGNVAQVPDNRRYILSQRTIAFDVALDLISENFLATVLRSPNVVATLTALSSGGTAKGVSQKSLSTVCIIIPTNLEEQKQLANTFLELDKLITLHQSKYDKLTNIKRAMLEKMFPKDGADVPEIRFKGFSDAWEQRKLGTVGNFKNGMNFSKDAMGHGYAFVNLQNIFGKSVIDTEKLELAEASETQLHEYNLQEGDVLFVRSSVKLEGVGETAIIPKTLENTTYSGFIIRFRDELGIDKNYKRYVFSTTEIRKQIMAQATNSANKNISQPVLENLKIKFPINAEQKKIGEYFENLDKLITLHQCKLEKLKNIKKACMEKMFV